MLKFKSNGLFFIKRTKIQTVSGICVTLSQEKKLCSNDELVFLFVLFCAIIGFILPFPV